MKIGKVFGKAFGKEKVVKTSYEAKSLVKEPVKQVSYSMKTIFSDIKNIKSGTKVERQSHWNFQKKKMLSRWKKRCKNI